MNVFDRDYGTTEINTLIDHSSIPPALLEFKILCFKLMEIVSKMFQNWYLTLHVNSFWAVIMKPITQEYPNLCNFVNNPVISISCSNSTVETGFRISLTYQQIND